MKFLSRAKKLFHKGGWRKFRSRIENDRRRTREVRNYQRWIVANRLTDRMRETMRRQIETFGAKPMISIVLPVYNVEEKWLRLCIESVINQIYENWELCIADDCSPLPHVKRVLEEYAAKDARITVVFRETNGHISAASNSALATATGAFVVLLDHDDELSEDALFHVAKEINDYPAIDFIYSDEDMIDEAGQRYTPKFKPDFSRDFLYSVNYVTHLAIYRTEILKKIGGFRVGLEGSQDYDLALRVVERISENRIRHIPKILYHWRAISGSVALSGDEKPYAHLRAREAISQHLERTGKSATVEETVYNLHRVRYRLPTAPPKVCLILQADTNSKFTERAIENYLAQTDYEDYEIVLIGNADGTRTNLQNVRFIAGENGSDAEKLNRAVSSCDGAILCFADVNLKPLTKDWLKEMVSFALQAEIGVTGAKILDADETVLHGGLIFGGETELASAAHRGHARDSGDNIGRLQLINNFSAMSVSCLATRREVFEMVGGFDAENFPNRFFDADFCLRLRREKNYRIVYTPYAELSKIDRRQRLNFEKYPTTAEKDRFVKKWHEVVERDPFYNPNLSKSRADFSIKI